MIGKRLQELRKRAGLTQNDVAARCHVSYQTISKWENDRSAPDIDLLPVLAQCFGVRIDDFFKEEREC